MDRTSPNWHLNCIKRFTCPVKKAWDIFFTDDKSVAGTFDSLTGRKRFYDTLKNPKLKQLYNSDAKCRASGSVARQCGLAPPV